MLKGESVDISRLAKLSQMTVGLQEAKKLKKGFKEILKTISDLEKLNTKKVSSTFQVTGLKNIFRQDKIDKSRMLTQKQALSNAKKKYQGYFVVPAIFK